MEHSQFKYIGLSHKNAPLSLRSLVVLDDAQCAALIGLVKETAGLSDLLVLSTCNRTELYYSAEQDLSNYLLQTLLGLLQLKDEQEEKAVRAAFVVCNDHDEAVQHLFSVALGLSSQVVGDLQISHQVKKAYQLSADLQVAGPFLHRLLHATFFANKRVVQETNFRDGTASVAYAVVDLVEGLSDMVPNPSVLVLGAGDMAADIARNLKGRGFGQVTIANRTLSKATQLAQELDFDGMELSAALRGLQAYDAVISTLPGTAGAGVGQYHIGLDEVLALNLLSYKYFIDVAVPQSIDPQVDTVPGAVCYNLDQLNEKREKVIQRRKAAMPAVAAIIEESMAELKHWEQEMLVSPTIHQLKSALDQIRQEEINRHLKDLDSHEMEKIDLISKSMMQKIIKLPVLQLKAACKRGEAATLIDVLNDLFDLERNARDPQPSEGNMADRAPVKVAGRG